MFAAARAGYRPVVLPPHGPVQPPAQLGPGLGGQSGVPRHHHGPHRQDQPARQHGPAAGRHQGSRKVPVQFKQPANLQISVVDPNPLNLDPDPGFRLNLDPNPDPG